MNKSKNDNDLNARVIGDFLKQLGYTDESAKIYLALTKTGPSTLLNISKVSGIERTKLYRMIDELIENGILEEVPAYKRKMVKAVDLVTIELLLKEKESQLKTLRESLPLFSQAVSDISIDLVPDVNVTYYRGVEGMKQMIWHSVSDVDFLRTYSYRFWNDILGDKFTLEANRILRENKTKIHDLYSDQYLEYKENWMKEKGKKPAGDWSFWNARYIPEKIVRINQNIDIYDDTVAYSYWDGPDIFGVEIKSQRVADMQKQVHDVLWQMGKVIGHFDWANPKWEK
jgi:DNA-binding MarR family transcriptional regulator